MIAEHMAFVIQKATKSGCSTRNQIVSKKNKFHDRWLGPYEVVARRSDLVYDISDPNSAKIKRVHFNLLKRAPDNFKQELKINPIKPDVVKLSSGSNDETVLLPLFAGDLDIGDNVRNIPDIQAPVDPIHAPLAPNEIVNHDRNAGGADRQAPVENLPQRGHGRYNL